MAEPAIFGEPTSPWPSNAPRRPPWPDAARSAVITAIATTTIRGSSASRVQTSHIATCAASGHIFIRVVFSKFPSGHEFPSSLGGCGGDRKIFRKWRHTGRGLNSLVSSCRTTENFVRDGKTHRDQLHVAADTRVGFDSLQGPSSTQEPREVRIGAAASAFCDDLKGLISPARRIHLERPARPSLGMS